MFDAQYRIILRPLTAEEGGGWYAEIPELSGCSSDGESPQEALTNLEDAKKAWLDTASALQRPIPAPKILDTEFSGKFTIRIAKSLHRALAGEAEYEGLSLNQYVAYILADRHRLFYNRGKSEEAASLVSTLYHQIEMIPDAILRESNQIRKK